MHLVYNAQEKEKASSIVNLNKKELSNYNSRNMLLHNLMHFNYESISYLSNNNNYNNIRGKNHANFSF